jgi:hypothetical protein
MQGMQGMNPIVSSNSKTESRRWLSSAHNTMSNRHATVKRRRTGFDGQQLLLVVCPICRSPHWVAAADTGHCLRRPGSFTINKNGARP